MAGVTGSGWWVAFALALGTGCNPFDAFAECAYRSIPLESVDVDVEARRDSFLGDHAGTLTWARTETTTTLLVRISPSLRPIVARSDCDGELDGFAIPLDIAVSSDDGLVAFQSQHELRLDETGTFETVSPAAIVAELSFESLKAAGVTPPDWVSNFSPLLRVPLSEPELTPDSGTVTDEVGPHDARRTVVLGVIEFP